MLKIMAQSITFNNLMYCIGTMDSKMSNLSNLLKQIRKCVESLLENPRDIVRFRCDLVQGLIQLSGAPSLYNSSLLHVIIMLRFHLVAYGLLAAPDFKPRKFKSKQN